MKALLLTAILIISLFSCKKENRSNVPISDCIGQKINEFKAKFENCSACFVESAIFKGNRVFIFDYGSIHDAPAVVLNQACDVIGGWNGDLATPFFFEFQTHATDKKRIWR